MKNQKSWLERNISLPVLAKPEAEKENSISHAIAAVLAVIGLIYIILNLDKANNPNLKIGLIIFALSNLLLYFASSLYHGLPKNNAKRVCRILDHSNIYFLIAGTYSPLLLFVNTDKSIKIFYFLWIIALLGVAFTLIFWGKLKPLHVVLYLIMGWILVFFWNDIIPNLPKGVLTYILTGGILYTLGVIFYGFKKIPHGHLIWHIFCIAASITFYVGIVKFLL
ncbi:MAG: hemolysin III family protein [Sphaerochaetaceae bacterium]|jgi:hemolysin III|nr:hemolysin III family protein [Sphaerochaetaceae bacterium]MDC7250949.1 hemolysin III family protein [Sphaerochaetaceae bacterium]